MTRTLALAAVAAVAALASVEAADAKRAPTFNERVAIIRSLPAQMRNYPAGCVAFVVIVSNNGRYAEAGLEFLIPRPSHSNDPCVKYASNGFWILKRTARGWKKIFLGSDGPPCSLGVPRDLMGCVKR